MIRKSWCKNFADIVFPAINEERFSVRYSENHAARPNTPVNFIVGSLMLKENNGLTDEELVESICCDVRYQYALHTTHLTERPVSERTFSHFHERLYNCEMETDRNLLEEKMMYLADTYAKYMDLNSNVKRMDCLMVASRCKRMSRLEIIYQTTANAVRLIYRLTDSNLNHTGIYLYSKGKIMIHLTFDYKTDEKCTTPGQYLKYHRTFQGFTTRELAEKVGIVPATLVLYENDRHPIKHSTAVALANALGIDRNRLLDKYTAFVDYPYSSLLKKVRQELSLTQMQMAEVIGIGQTSYSGWEREIRVPRRKEYEKILAALKKLKVNVDTYLCHPAST